jgi:hypothetical protein
MASRLTRLEMPPALFDLIDNLGPENPVGFRPLPDGVTQFALILLLKSPLIDSRPGADSSF